MADPCRGVVPCSGSAVSHAFETVRRYANLGQVAETRICCSAGASPALHSNEIRRGTAVISGAPVTISVNCFPIHPHPSDARTVNVNSPVCSGAPEKYPNRDKAIPGGNAPETTAYPTPPIGHDPLTLTSNGGASYPFSGTPQGNSTVTNSISVVNNGTSSAISIKVRRGMKGADRSPDI